MTRHHIIPVSKGGKTNKTNIVLKTDQQHKAYHYLFSNSLPEEAVKILIQEWFYKDPLKRNKAILSLIKWLSSLLITKGT